MTPKPTPAWPLPVMALVQIWVATVLISALREPGAPWNAGYAALSTIGSLLGLVILALAARNCVRLWRAEPWEASWGLVAATVLVALFSALWATGPVTIGVWRWESLVPGTLAAYLIMVLVRDVSRLLARRKEPAQFMDS